MSVAIAPPRVRAFTTCACIVAELRGEIDIRTVPAFTAALDTIRVEAPSRLVLDLRQVTFIDCTGLGMLCRTRRRALERGVKTSLLVTDPRILRTLHATRLTRAFDVHGRLSEVPLTVPVAAA
ncbi:STAS domain-containing protein [Streptomyces sp. A7024]|uniref:Anti-sigma factor antagonist n=1 Tax=Streptomyces coryli TaxID=1128680 RepID=A0A6G4TRQ9_9ACTN|nr:STAS domain-containing protein [Streptomyces coryli]NGN62473.1 STAS domain-containing protein [Streptomyces coryli]